MTSKIINNATVQELDELIKTAEYNYIYEEKQLYSDAEYDSMLERYSFLTGTPRLSNVSIPSDCTLTKLPVWMPSLSKALHGSNTLELWTKKVACNYLVSMKLDGCSALYSGRENKLYTRGTYIEGQDITLLLPFLNLPKVDMMIRGELIIPNSVFNEKYAKSYVNARATVAGISRAFNIASYSEEKITVMQKEIAGDIDFVAYEIITISNTEMKPQKQMALLEELKFKTVKHMIVDAIISNETLSKIYPEMDTDNDYAFDGLVITRNQKYVRCTNERPKYAIAYKKELENLIGFSEVISVSWNVSKCGYIKPIVNIKPIIINSVLISKTTGINARFIEQNVIGPGAKVKIIRSGDVIPNIAEVLSPATNGTPDMPINIAYVWNDTLIDIIVNDEGSQDKVIQQIKFFLKTLKIKGIDKKYIERICNMSTNYNSILAFTRLKQVDIAELGDVLSNKIILNIKNGIQKATPAELMTASGIFGRGLGIKRINEIFAAFPPDFIANGRSYDIAALREMLATISGFGKVMTELFIGSFYKYLDWHDSLGLNPDEINTSIAPTETNYLTNKIISITGTRNVDILAFIAKIGAHLKPLSSKTHILIVKDYTTHNKKTELVAEKGFKCKVVSVDDFIKTWL